jgi:hypothetical protein
MIPRNAQLISFYKDTNSLYKTNIFVYKLEIGQFAVLIDEEEFDERMYYFKDLMELKTWLYQHYQYFEHLQHILKQIHEYENI